MVQNTALQGAGTLQPPHNFLASFESENSSKNKKYIDATVGFTIYMELIPTCLSRGAPKSLFSNAIPFCVTFLGMERSAILTLSLYKASQ